MSRHFLTPEVKRKRILSLRLRYLILGCIGLPLLILAFWLIGRATGKPFSPDLLLISSVSLYVGWAGNVILGYLKTSVTTRKHFDSFNVTLEDDVLTIGWQITKFTSQSFWDSDIGNVYENRAGTITVSTKQGVSGAIPREVDGYEQIREWLLRRHSIKPAPFKGPPAYLSPALIPLLVVIASFYIPVLTMVTGSLVLTISGVLMLITLRNYQDGQVQGWEILMLIISILVVVLIMLAMV